MDGGEAFVDETQGEIFTSLEDRHSSEHDESTFAWQEDWFDEGADLGQGIGQDVVGLKPEQVLKRYWMYDSFRPLQRDIIDSVLSGYDTLALLPTGGGKSICFQIPGLMLKGTTLVITPLISLMKDQVDHLRSKGIKATAIHSGMGAERIRQTMDNCLYGSYKFLYISPERLSSLRFREQLANLSISLLVVDECHCICQWGYDFRPSYLGILELKNYIPQVPIIALTATATPDVLQDIKQILGFGQEARTFCRSFYRGNLSYAIRRTNNKEETLGYILNRVAGSSIVYCRSREQCRDLAHYLTRELGISATFFHAGLTHTERDIRQNRWKSGEVRVMVATNAFGMGIDKPDVRLVVHMSMPSSLEEYYQEAGRAGRDGLRSYAVVLLSEIDPKLLERRLKDSFPSEEYILYTYDMLCNYLGIGEGEGLDRSYEFDIKDFVRIYRMRPAQTKPAIDIMALSGWLEYKEEDAASRLMFVCTREDLYREYVGHDKLLRALLRSYTGLFSDYVFINETEIALLTGYTAQEVYEILILLSKQGILHYIPRRNIPRIIFRIRREDTKYLKLQRTAYKERQERMQERINAVLTYVRSESECRASILSAYFGEKGLAPCTKCDNCLAPQEQGLRRYIIETCRYYLHQKRREGLGRLLLQDLVDTLDYQAQDIITAVRYLVAEAEPVDGTYLRLVGDILIFEDTMSQKEHIL